MASKPIPGFAIFQFIFTLWVISSHFGGEAHHWTNYGYLAEDVLFIILGFSIGLNLHQSQVLPGPLAELYKAFKTYYPAIFITEIASFVHFLSLKVHGACTLKSLLTHLALKQIWGEAEQCNEHTWAFSLEIYALGLVPFLHEYVFSKFSKEQTAKLYAFCWCLLLSAKIIFDWESLDQTEGVAAIIRSFSNVFMGYALSGLYHFTENKRHWKYDLWLLAVVVLSLVKVEVKANEYGILFLLSWVPYLLCRSQFIQSLLDFKQKEVKNILGLSNSILLTHRFVVIFSMSWELSLQSVFMYSVLCVILAWFFEAHMDQIYKKPFNKLFSWIESQAKPKRRPNNPQQQQQQQQILNRPNVENRSNQPNFNGGSGTAEPKVDGVNRRQMIQNDDFELDQ